MQTLQFWNSIKECGLPALVHSNIYEGGIYFYSDSVLLGVEGTSPPAIYGRLLQFGKTDNPKLCWEFGENCDFEPVTAFTHWAYIPDVPKN